MEVTNRFKGLDLIDRMPEQLWTGVHHFVQEAMIKTILRKKKRNKAKWLSEEALQTAMTIREKERKVKKIREVKGKGEKKKIYAFEYRVPKNSKER